MPTSSREPTKNLRDPSALSEQPALPENDQPLSRASSGSGFKRRAMSVDEFVAGVRDEWADVLKLIRASMKNPVHIVNSDRELNATIQALRLTHRFRVERAEKKLSRLREPGR